MPTAPTKHLVDRFANYYDYVKTKDLTLSENYQSIGTLDTETDRSFGVYEIKLSLTANLNLTNKSIYFRWRTNGGDWNELIGEPKDRTDDRPFAYFYVIEHVTGPMKFEFEMRKEDTNGVLILHFFDAILQKVGV